MSDPVDKTEAPNDSTSPQTRTRATPTGKRNDPYQLNLTAAGPDHNQVSRQSSIETTGQPVRPTIAPLNRVSSLAGANAAGGVSPQSAAVTPLTTRYIPTNTASSPQFTRLRSFPDGTENYREDSSILGSGHVMTRSAPQIAPDAARSDHSLSVAPSPNTPANLRMASTISRTYSGRSENAVPHVVVRTRSIRASHSVDANASTHSIPNALPGFGNAPSHVAATPCSRSNSFSQYSSQSQRDVNPGGAVSTTSVGGQLHGTLQQQYSEHPSQHSRSPSWHFTQGQPYTQGISSPGNPMQPSRENIPSSFHHRRMSQGYDRQTSFGYEDAPAAAYGASFAQGSPYPRHQPCSRQASFPQGVRTSAFSCGEAPIDVEGPKHQWRNPDSAAGGQVAPAPQVGMVSLSNLPRSVHQSSDSANPNAAHRPQPLVQPLALQAMEDEGQVRWVRVETPRGEQTPTYPNVPVGVQRPAEGGQRASGTEATPTGRTLAEPSKQAAAPRCPNSAPTKTLAKKESPDATKSTIHQDKYANHYKTKACRNYASPEGCPFGDRCRFAHGAKDVHTYVANERAGIKTVAALESLLQAKEKSSSGPTTPNLQ